MNSLFTIQIFIFLWFEPLYFAIIVYILNNCEDVWARVTLKAIWYIEDKIITVETYNRDYKFITTEVIIQ